MGAIFETQKAVYAQLVADATLSAMISGIYDYVPQDTAYPYITLGNIMGNESDSPVNGKAYQLDITVNAYSNKPGHKEALLIIEQVRVLLENVPLTITGFDHIATRLQKQSTEKIKPNGESSCSGVFRITIRSV